MRQPHSPCWAACISGFAAFNLSESPLGLQTTIISTHAAASNQGLLIQEALEWFPPPTFN